MEALETVERGSIFYAPRLGFELTHAERRFLSPNYLDGNSKNVSLRPGAAALDGTRCRGPEHDELLTMLQRYRGSTRSLLDALGYGEHLRLGFTSFRPAEVAGRSTTWQRDDTRLHVDAFPARPTQGLQILRVFTNVNPQTPRVWRVGEAFENVAARFLPRIRHSRYNSCGE